MRFLRSAVVCIAVASPLAARAVALPAMTYDVVSIKPNKSGSGSVRISIDRERFVGTNVSVKALIRYAYDLETEDLISGLPGWAGSSNLDIEAKVSAEDVAALKKFSDADSTAERRLMMQALLAERFVLKVHHENKELPTSALVVLKSGLKIIRTNSRHRAAQRVGQAPWTRTIQISPRRRFRCRPSPPFLRRS